MNEMMRTGMLFVTLAGLYAAARAQEPDRTTVLIDKTIRSQHSIELKSITNGSLDSAVAADPSPVRNAHGARSSAGGRRIAASAVIGAFGKYIESDGYLSDRAIETDKAIVDRHIECLNNWQDKAAYVRDQNLADYLRQAQDSLARYEKRLPVIVQQFMDGYERYGIEDADVCREELTDLLETKLQTRANYLDGLERAMASDVSVRFDLARIDDRMLINAAAIGGVLILLIVWFVCARKRRSARHRPIGGGTPSGNGSAAIVVRRKTTSILKRQSLEDVIDNGNYLKIECADFCDDSAVRRIYLKNTCIKEIYDMYAEDLRNSDNPKEDGCMVLGRWVCDHETGEYYVSLEYVVRPGDDAVFQEYELNFGGKIKLKVAEKLRKLRRETNLQYDLTCWVHSHPGLGVFFSNSDSSVQLQLKHPTHPNFLTAIVVDILTPRQELGIFTFRHDSTINSKNDLKRMYSLEEMHKWAVESDRNAFRAEDHFDVLAGAADRFAQCCGIALSNGAIIDMSAIVSEFPTGLVGWAYGCVYADRGQVRYVVKAIRKRPDEADDELLGCFVIGTHCSIPSIRKAVADYSATIGFVLFYSSSDETLTSIPVRDDLLCMDDRYYGEEKLENLKIWTRRKR